MTKTPTNTRTKIVTVLKVPRLFFGENVCMSIVSNKCIPRGRKIHKIQVKITVKIKTPEEKSILQSIKLCNIFIETC